MYTRYDYSTTAKIQDVVMDVCKVLGGETNKANLSSSCVQGATSITATQASGWEFVTCSSEGSIAAHSTSAATIAESTTQGKFFRSNPSAGTVTVYSYLNGTMTTADATITTSANPTLMAINNSTNRLYVLCGSAVTVINTVNNSVVATVTLPLAGQAIAINTATNKIYVGDSTGVNVIDGSNNTTSKTTLSISVGANGKMAVNESTGFMYWTTTNTIRKYNLSANTVSTVYTASSTLYDVAIDTANNVYYVSGAYAEGSRIWGFDGATDSRQASAFATIASNNAKMEAFSSSRVMAFSESSYAYAYDLDSKAQLRSVYLGSSLSTLSRLSDSAVCGHANSSAYRIDATQGNRPMVAGLPFYFFRSLNADGLTYKYMRVTFTGSATPTIGMSCLEPYSTSSRSIAGLATASATNVSASLGGTLFIGSSNRYAFLSGWINGTFQTKLGLVERTRDSAWDTPAYGVQPVVQVSVDGLGGGGHVAPRVKTLAGADTFAGGYSDVTLLRSGSSSLMALIPDADFVSKNPVVYVNFIEASRGDLGGRALGLPITTANLGTNLDEIIYNNNTYVMFACSNGNRVMVPKF